MTHDSDAERHMVEAMVHLDRAQEIAPLTVSQGLGQAIDQLDACLDAYREGKAAEEPDS